MQSDSAAFQIVYNAMRAANLRQQVYANNIANMETPGYHREDVQFENALQTALATNTEPGSAAVSDTSGQAPGSNSLWMPIPAVGSDSLNLMAGLSVQPTVVESGGSSVDNNGNNVDVDAEMSDLAENQIKYETLVQDLQSRFSRLTTAINS